MIFEYIVLFLGSSLLSCCIIGYYLEWLGYWDSLYRVSRLAYLRRLRSFRYDVLHHDDRSLKSKVMLSRFDCGIDISHTYDHNASPVYYCVLTLPGRNRDERWSFTYETVEKCLNRAMYALYYAERKRYLGRRIRRGYIKGDRINMSKEKTPDVTRRDHRTPW